MYWPCPGPATLSRRGRPFKLRLRRCADCRAGTDAVRSLGAARGQYYGTPGGQARRDHSRLGGPGPPGLLPYGTVGPRRSRPGRGLLPYGTPATESPGPRAALFSTVRYPGGVARAAAFSKL
eukprot:39276-Hanusia_phi.AAC.2